MNIASNSTIMVACECPESAQTIVERLASEGFGVLGPVRKASAALALAAQTPFTLAVVSRRLAGRRHGPELAEDLMSSWGAPSILIEQAEGDEAWHASDEVAQRVRAIIGDAAPPPQG